MDVRNLFLETLDELERYLARGDAYSMLRASALLRQLLLDGNATVHQVNREHRLKLTYPVCGRKITETVLRTGPVFYSALAGIHSSGGPGLVENLTQDEFFATPVLKLGSQVLSVRDLIRISANVLGGVHRDKSGGSHGNQEEKEKAVALEEFSKEFLVVPGVPLSAGQLRPVILVVLDGLRPLRELVKKNTPPHRI